MKSNKSLQKSKILLIYTGGTIGMIENQLTGALEAFDFAYLKDNVPELNRLDCEIEVIQYNPPRDSSAISVDLWEQLAYTIKENYDHVDGFVILHGTDTMAYTASALSFMLVNLCKPVILTGSQLPIGQLRTDGKENLITAIEIAADKNDDGSAKVPEVCIFFGDFLLRGNRTTKVSADQFSAFASHNYPPLASAGIDITYFPKNILNSVSNHTSDHRAEFSINTMMDRHVAILKIFPGILPEVIESVVSIPGLKGLVLETYGSGNAPMEDWFLHPLKEAVRKGILVVNVTQCSFGYVDMKRYETGHSLLQIGIVSGYDSTTASALTKMMHLFGRGFSTEQVGEYMSKSIRGEITR